MALTSDQKSSKLFKQAMGVSESRTARDFFEEPYLSARTIFPSQVWNQADLIPTTAPVGMIDGQIVGVVQRLIDRAMIAIPGTTNSFYLSDAKDVIPFNFGDGSYNYALKTSGDVAIPFGQGDWILDPDAGVLSFYGTVPSGMPPKISFFKYVGTKGVGGGGSVPEPFDYRNLAQETRTEVYISDIGSDTTGDGTIALPFATLEHAVSILKPLINDITFFISGNHILSVPLNEILEQKTFIGSTRIRSYGTLWDDIQTGIDFTENGYFKHTLATGTWIPETYAGHFLYDPTSTQYLPIAGNTATEIIHGGDYNYTILDITNGSIRKLHSSLTFSLTKAIKSKTQFELLNLNIPSGFENGYTNTSLIAINSCTVFFTNIVGRTLYASKGFIASDKSAYIFSSSDTNYNLIDGSFENCAFSMNTSFCSNLLGNSVFYSTTQKNMSAIISTDERFQRMYYYDLGFYNFDYGFGYYAPRGNFGALLTIAGHLERTGGTLLAMFNIGDGWQVFEDSEWPLLLVDIGTQGYVAYDGVPYYFLVEEQKGINLSCLKNYFNHYTAGHCTGVNRKTQAEITALPGLLGTTGIRIFNTDLNIEQEYRNGVWVEV